MIRGFAFFSVLFVASLLLSPAWLFALLPQPCKLWVVRRWTNQLWSRTTILLTALFFVLCSWLIYSAPRDLRQGGKEEAPKGPGSNLLVSAGASASR